ncbi:glycosyltransferase family 2 protein [Terrisporobacter glycolicus]|uniref:Glycosyltransferase 2-like domain-containing protein n=1 Tax=Terrisporobacter glycolicus ATCC 14880 = DSM 1288 TaxID=1121315 RepID=A0ABZ2ESA0_9FIRM|nr:glycosyltransferase family 2 protein [Terrisporobacter glycolicus]
MIKKNMISFLVPTLGKREKELMRLFDSLEKQKQYNFEVVVVVQDNYENISKLCKKYKKFFFINVINDDKKGLSKGRNKGKSICKGDIVVLSDDDCWYPEDASIIIAEEFAKNDIDVLLTQIYDKINDVSYKKYSTKETVIKSQFDLLSRSSIEIAFKNRFNDLKFDELFGLGSKYVCCEEVDFLLRLYRCNASIKYLPRVTVFHEKKLKGSNDNAITAKGALYAKHFNLLIALMVCMRDVIKKGENNFRLFFGGYNEYSKRVRKTSISR